MGRNRIEIKPIMQNKNRRTTFVKRKNGLLKKAMELSVLCNAKVGVVIFNEHGKLSQFSSTEMKDILMQYSSYYGQIDSRTIKTYLKEKGSRIVCKKAPEFKCEPTVEVDRVTSPNDHLSEKRQNQDIMSASFTDTSSFEETDESGDLADEILIMPSTTSLKLEDCNIITQLDRLTNISRLNDDHDANHYIATNQSCHDKTSSQKLPMQVRIPDGNRSQDLLLSGRIMESMKPGCTFFELSSTPRNLIAPKFENNSLLPARQHLGILGGADNKDSFLFQMSSIS